MAFVFNMHVNKSLRKIIDIHIAMFIQELQQTQNN